MVEEIKRRGMFDHTEKEEKDRIKAMTQEIASCGYTVRKKIGEGAYGAVFSVTKTNDVNAGLKALKRVMREDEIVGLPNLIEIDILSRLRHPNLMYAEDILVSDPRSGCQIDVEGLVLPLANYRLQDLWGNALISPDMWLKILYQVFCAVRFLHLQGILHLDLTSDNIVLQGPLSDLHPLVTDFGISVYAEDLQGYLSKTDTTNEGSDILNLSNMMKKYLGVELVSTKNKKTRFLDSKKRIRLAEVLEDPVFTKVSHKGCPVGYVVPVFTEGVPFPSQAPSDTLVTLGEILVLNFPGTKTEVLFLAIDLLQRTGHLVGDLEDNQRLIHLHLSTCIWMAVKMLVVEPRAPSKGFRSLSGITIPPEDTISVEAVIVKFLEGRLYRRWLYHGARDLGDLVAAYHLLGNSEIDLNQDPQEVIRSFSYYSKSDTRSKDITAEEFLQISEEEVFTV